MHASTSASAPHCEHLPVVLPVDSTGRCYTTEFSIGESQQQKNFDGEHAKQWPCTSLCKPIQQWEADSILELMKSFELPVDQLRQQLNDIDSGCPYTHFARPCQNECNDDTSQQPLRGHPLHCYVDSGCTSKLRILRTVSVHFPLLRKILRLVYNALRAHNSLLLIDSSLHEGHFVAMMSLLGFNSFDELMSNNVANTFTTLDSSDTYDLIDEADLCLKHTEVIVNFNKEISDFPVNVCCCCERLHQRKSVSKIALDTNLDNPAWLALIAYIQCINPSAENEILYMCNYCKPLVRNGIMPPRCVLNGLEVLPVPKELQKLDYLSRQIIQLAKCYQTVVRLGTNTKKVPLYNSLKACKGTMFFLPLPITKTLATIDDLSNTDTLHLPNPELFIILNGQPTKSKSIWRSLVNISNVRAAVDKLKEINILYMSLDSSSIDDAAKKFVEVSTTSKSTMMVKATSDDIQGFQSYTIRNMDNHVFTENDTEQYKMLSIKDAPLDNRMKFLDVMCFPVLYPTGKFGEHHDRQVKISHGEFIKSRLLNKDSRFRKDPQYIFYLLWQKEMRELSGGVYNMLKSGRKLSLSAGTLLKQIEAADPTIEARLSTMLQSVRGTKQYWFLRKSELQCMIRKFGSPTFFLTFSCAEYESPDMTKFLFEVNDVPPSYNIGKLCTEDPVSVSRKFSLRFHAFFQTVISKGQVLGKVSHFYWKKEYQSRGAPHYHALVWIEDAPVIGVDPPEKVLAWIDDRISCQIPDDQLSPELHQLVTRFQLHKCSNYCKRRRRCGKTFITRCRFGFPRPACEASTLNDVQGSLKSWQRIYHLKRKHSEERVNDYNPLILLLWKANVDLPQGHYSWSQGMGILGDKVQECQEFVTFLPTSLLFICKRGNASLHSAR